MLAVSRKQRRQAQWGSAGVTVKTSTGRHVLQIPGPGPVPDRILRAIDMPVIDHRGPAFASLAKGILCDLKTIFRTGDDALIYPSSGTLWDAHIFERG
jgi:alanine-glyoxylate transaminase / serine-glyoxylate transaminase / serine-pyruvate transaminase